MLNPSTADHRVDDPTIKRLIHFTASWGYGGFVAVNIYPFRSPHPAACKSWVQSKIDRGARNALTANLQHILTYAADAPRFLAAWGNGFDELAITSVVQRLQCDIYCLGTTVFGAPKHPLARGKYRIPNDQQPIRWTPP